MRVPLGVDLATFVPAHATAATTEAHQPGVARLVHAGRLSKEKEPELMLAAVRELVARGCRVQLDVFGDGPERKRLEGAAAGLPITFHGYVSQPAELARHLAAADVALTLCPGETFGLAVLEAMACGTPVVTARTSGAGELVAPDAEDIDADGGVGQGGIQRSRGDLDADVHPSGPNHLRH